MSSRKSLVIATLCILFITNTSSAVMCARLKSVSGGEDHTLALMDNGTLWACGDNSWGRPKKPFFFVDSREIIKTLTPFCASY